MTRSSSWNRRGRLAPLLTLAGGLWLAPAWAGAAHSADAPSLKKIGVALALAQLLPLLHMLVTDKLLSCYKAGYCMMYTAFAALSWIVALLMMEFFPAAPRLYLVGILLSPYLFWLYAFTMGQRQKNQDFTYCKVKLKKR